MQEKTFIYDTKLGADKCYNEFCRWSDKVAPAIDVPMSLLEFCLENVKEIHTKERIKKIIGLTKEMNRNII